MKWTRNEPTAGAAGPKKATIHARRDRFPTILPAILSSICSFGPANWRTHSMKPGRNANGCRVSAMGPNTSSLPRGAAAATIFLGHSPVSALIGGCVRGHFVAGSGVLPRPGPVPPFGWVPGCRRICRKSFTDCYRSTLRPKIFALGGKFPDIRLTGLPPICYSEVVGCVSLPIVLFAERRNQPKRYLAHFVTSFWGASMGRASDGASVRSL